MEDEVSTAEAIRLYRSRRANTKARWNNVYRMWQEGKTLAEIGKWIGKSESTVRQLLKRAALEKQKSPGFVWPVDKAGRKICDIPHPMPSNEDPRQWFHLRAFALTPTRTPKAASTRQFCPVCKKGFMLGKTLMEILT